MGEAYFSGETLDDTMRLVVKEILSRGIWIEPSKGGCKELTGVLLEIQNPRARFSRTETKGKPFSSLGELCWYLAKTNELKFIQYYLSKYTKYADGNIIYGGYGPRLFNWKEIDQVDRVISLLKRNPDSRKAVIQLFDSVDLVEKHNDVPCTSTMQFFIRDGKLQMLTNMRSNDAFLGLPHDIFCFTMLQEIIAKSLNLDLGIYKHSVGSIHLYDENQEDARQYIEEGWQPTNMAMPPMPVGDPWPSIKILLDAELDIRTKGNIFKDYFMDLDPYWADLIRILQIFRCLRDKNKTLAQKHRDSMISEVYNSFIDKRLNNL